MNSNAKQQSPLMTLSRRSFSTAGFILLLLQLNMMECVGFQVATIGSSAAYRSSTAALASSAREDLAEAATKKNVEKEPVMKPRWSLLSKARPEIRTLESMDDLLDFVREDDRLCVIKFYAHWCKSCQKFGTQYQKLAGEHGDHITNKGKVVRRGRVRFAQVEFGQNTKLCRALGVTRLPTVHLYKAPVGKIHDFPCGPKKFPLLKEKVAHCLSLDDKELRFEQKMERGSALASGIAQDIRKAENSTRAAVAEKQPRKGMIL